VEIADILLDHGANIDCLIRDHSTVLMMAAGSGQTEMVKCLIRRNANINVTSRRSPGSALDAAIQSGYEDIVNVLLDAGADVSITGRIFGQICSPLQGVLHLETLCNRRELAKRLIEQGADVNANHAPFGSPLQLAAAKGDLSIVQLLLDHGADVDLVGATLTLLRYKLPRQQVTYLLFGFCSIMEQTFTSKGSVGAMRYKLL